MQKVLVDANILRSRTLRDWCFKLHAELGSMFSILTTEDIIAEAAYTMRRDNPGLDGGVISSLVERVKDFADEIVTDFSCDVEYSGSDPHDLHVHAAAVHSGSNILLTADTSFADMARTQDLPYSVYEADAFFTLIDDSASSAVLAVTETQLAYWKQKDKTPNLTNRLRNAGCPGFADRVEMHLLTLSGIPQYSPERLLHKKRLQQKPLR